MVSETLYHDGRPYELSVLSGEILFAAYFSDRLCELLVCQLLVCQCWLTWLVKGLLAVCSSTIPGDGKERAKWHMAPKQAPAEAQPETRRRR